MNEVEIIDSLVAEELPNSVLLQIARIYSRTISLTQPTLEIKILSVQQQTGFDDCGIFAIAYAVEICHGNNPENCRFKQSLMRSHLRHCLEVGRLTSFPTSSSPCRVCSHKVVSLGLYCICRMPEWYDENMVNCDACGCWFHFSCMKRLKNRYVKGRWECLSCKRSR